MAQFTAMEMKKVKIFLKKKKKRVNKTKKRPVQACHPWQNAQPQGARKRSPQWATTEGAGAQGFQMSELSFKAKFDVLLLGPTPVSRLN